MSLVLTKAIPHSRISLLFQPPYVQPGTYRVYSGQALPLARRDLAKGALI